MIVSFYNLESGLFTGQAMRSNFDSHLKSTPPGCGWIEGLHDHLSRRVDLATGNVVDFIPPQPSPDYEWDAATKRWVPSAAAIAKRRDSKAALARIDELERSQARAIREMLLDKSPKLKQIDDEIATLRGKL